MPPDERQAVIARITAGLQPAGGCLGGTSGATHEGVGELLEACWQALGGGEHEPGWGEAVTG